MQNEQDRGAIPHTSSAQSWEYSAALQEPGVSQDPAPHVNIHPIAVRGTQPPIATGEQTRLPGRQGSKHPCEGCGQSA